VLTATFHSNGQSKNSTPYRIKTADPIEIKFGTVDTSAARDPFTKLYANPFWQIGKIRKNFSDINIPFFL